jgi:hypothetical protein
MDELSVEDKFKQELFQRHGVCKRVYIPKDEYFATIEQLKEAGNNQKTKTRQEYYILQR